MARSRSLFAVACGLWPAACASGSRAFGAFWILAFSVQSFEPVLTFPRRILVLAAAVFFFGTEATPGGPATLFDAYALLRDRLGAGKCGLSFLRRFLRLPCPRAALTLPARFPLTCAPTAAATLFALALLAAGQSSSIIATLAAQIVSEGFIQWSMSVSFRPLSSPPRPFFSRTPTANSG